MGTVIAETEWSKEPRSVMTGSRWSTGTVAALAAIFNLGGLANAFPTSLSPGAGKIDLPQIESFIKL
jgi:hypothetical protein